VLLGSDGTHKAQVRGQRNPANEDANDLIKAQKCRDGCEYITERQPFFGQACLRGRSSDFASKLQRTMRSEEVVMASQQLNVIFQSLGTARVTEAATTQVIVSPHPSYMAELNRSCAGASAIGCW
jgi:hypothetical protein